MRIAEDYKLYFGHVSSWCGISIGIIVWEEREKQEIPLWLYLLCKNAQIVLHTILHCFLIKILLNVYHLSCKFISSDIWWRTCRNQMKLFLNGVEIYLWPRFVQIELFACYIFFTGSKKVYSEIAWLCILFICALIFSLYFLVMLFIFAVGTPGCVVRQTHSWRHF